MFLIKIKSKVYQKLTFINKFNTSSYVKADKILRIYFQTRLSLSSSDYINYMAKLSLCRIPTQDHRWLNLILTIQKNCQSFNNTSKLQILRYLSITKQKNSLFWCLVKNLIEKKQSLNINEIITLFWCLIKVGIIDKQHITAIYTRIIEIINLNNVEQGCKQIIFTNNLDQYRVNEEFNQNQVELKPLNWVLLIWGMSKCKIVHSGLLKFMLKLKRNQQLEHLDLKMHCLLLSGLIELGLQNKRITQKVDKYICQKRSQLIKQSVLTLVNLIEAMCKFHETNFIQLSNKALQHSSTILEIIDNILSRHQDQQLSLKFNTILIYQCSKLHLFKISIWQQMLQPITKNINDAKIQDLSMLIKAICSLGMQERRILKKQQQIIVQRIWILYKSFYGKSLTNLKQLIQQEKLKPPFKILKMHLKTIQSEKIIKQRQNKTF